KRVVEAPSKPSKPGFEGFEGAQSRDFSDFLGPYSRVIAALEARCPDLIPADRWQAAVGDGRAFLAKWGEQAETLGWTVRDLFGLPHPPGNPPPTLQPPIPLRRARPDLAAAGPGSRGAHRGDRRDRDLDRRGHRLPTIQQAGPRSARRQPGRFPM